MCPEKHIATDRERPTDRQTDRQIKKERNSVLVDLFRPLSSTHHLILVLIRKKESDGTFIGSWNKDQSYICIYTIFVNAKFWPHPGSLSM